MPQFSPLHCNCFRALLLYESCCSSCLGEIPFLILFPLVLPFLLSPSSQSSPIFYHVRPDSRSSAGASHSISDP